MRRLVKSYLRSFVEWTLYSEARLFTVVGVAAVLVVFPAVSSLTGGGGRTDTTAPSGSATLTPDPTTRPGVVVPDLQLPTVTPTSLPAPSTTITPDPTPSPVPTVASTVSGAMGAAEAFMRDWLSGHSMDHTEWVEKMRPWAGSPAMMRELELDQPATIPASIVVNVAPLEKTKDTYVVTLVDGQAWLITVAATSDGRWVVTRKDDGHD